MNKIKLTIIVIVLLVTYSHATVINVPLDYTLIQEAIYNSSIGDTIVVANGIYNESIDFIGKEITVASNFIYTNDSEDIENTVIDANGTNFHAVKFVNGETVDSRLMGLSITGGNANGAEGFDRGGGIYCDVDGSAPIIDHCYIYDNSADGAGGGIALGAFAGEVLISNCKIYNNIAEGGGGMYLGSVIEASVINNCDIYNNTATDGGAILNLLKQSELNECSIFVNNASQNGSAIMAFSGLKIDKTLIYNNISSSENVFNLNSFGVDRDPMIIINSTIVNNGTEENNAFNLLGNSKLVIVNSILSNHSQNEIFANQENDTSQIEIAYSNIVDGQNSITIGTNCELNWEDSNISEDPLFFSEATNNFILLENSPCIDIGTANYSYNGLVILLILEGDYYGLTPDIGCFEYENQNSNDSGFVIPNNLELYNYPNPFNPTTTIDFTIQNASEVELVIYNVKGQKIKSLIKEYIESGTHSIIWNGANEAMQQVASGIYLYSLCVDGRNEAVNKCILSK